MRRRRQSRGGSVTAPKPELPHGRYDAGERRRSKRTGRERGCWLYIPLAELVVAGIDPEAPPPRYRVWASKGGGLRARLYKEEPCK